MRTLSIVAVLLGCCASPSATAPIGDADWDAVLRKHVAKDGRVDYAGIRGDERFARYIKSLETAAPQKLPDDKARLAFWINAYNALTIHGVLQHLPGDRAEWAEFKPTSIKIAGENFWRGHVFRVAGKSKMTLDGIEHGILRKESRYKDPRIHVALVCAARGCPPLLNRAYTRKQLDEQLTARMKKQVADPSRTRIDAKGKRLRLSKVFDWYRKDFVDPTFRPHATSLPAFIGKFVEPDALARSLAHDDWNTEFAPYDWRLNLRTP